MKLDYISGQNGGLTGPPVEPLSVRSSQPLVTYHTVTWNRRRKLANLLRSFDACNQYENFEWIIVDHGSTDGTIQFLESIQTDPNYKYFWGRIKILLYDEQDYIASLQQRGIELVTPRRTAHAFFGKYRNLARQAAAGDYLIDIPDDHQFIRPVNWVEELLAIYHHRIAEVGRDDIAALVFKTRLLYRILRKNQATEPARSASDNVVYYVCRFKGYDDYGMVSRTVAKQMGPYWQIDHVTDPKIIAAWNDPHDQYFSQTCPHYEHYLQRARQLNLKKIMVKYPYTHDLTNDLNLADSTSLAVPLTTTTALRRQFAATTHPVSVEEMEHFLTGAPGYWPLLKTKIEARVRNLA